MWYYTLNNQQVGPVDENEIKKLIASGAISHATMVWTTGMANWAPIGQSGLAPLMGAGAPPPPPVGAYPPMMVIEDPKVKAIKTLFMWFWITFAAGFVLSAVGVILMDALYSDAGLAIGTILFAIGMLGALAAAVFFFILIHKAWQLVQHEGIRASADQAVAYCFITPWNLYWFFTAFKGLAQEINLTLEKEKISAAPMNLSLALWFVISLLATPVLLGAIPFVVLLFMYTKKLVDSMVAITKARL